MIWKLQVLILCLFAISSMVTAASHLIATLHLASSITGLLDYSESLLEKIFDNSYQRANDALVAVQEMNNDIQNQMGQTQSMLKDLPYIFDHLTQKNKLKEHINNIGFGFKNAVEKKFNIKENRREDRSVYENFRNELELTLDQDIYEIYRMLLDGRTTSHLSRSFIDGVKLYDNVCTSQMSPQQLLNNLLVNLKLATIQYLSTKSLMYEFLQFYSDNPQQYDMTKENLRRSAQNNYNNAIRKFKSIIAGASQEIWRCDANKVTRYENKPGSPYFELMAFTKYVFNEAIFQLILGDDWSRCPEITKVDSCGGIWSGSDHGKYCKNTRKCPNNLIGCKNYHENHENKTRVCLNDDNSAFNRYKSFVPENELKQLICPGGTVAEIKDVRVISGASTRPGIKFWHNYCRCLCEEKSYYFQTTPVFTDYVTDNKVVVGVRFVIENDTIILQLKQGKLMPNALIDETSVEWVPTFYTSLRKKISWNDMRSVDLTSSLIGKGHAMIGAGLDVHEVDGRKRIRLITYRYKFSYSDGKLVSSGGARWPAIGKDELVLKDMDVPINSVKPNVIDSNDNQFLTFTLTDEELDGAQTTIPFIDTQDLVTNPPVPLSGMGLVHRGQPGFGGFLALKIYTYNVADHIPDVPEQVTSVLDDTSDLLKDSTNTTEQSS